MGRKDNILPEEAVSLRMTGLVSYHVNSINNSTQQAQPRKVSACLMTKCCFDLLRNGKGALAGWSCIVISANAYFPMWLGS